MNYNLAARTAGSAHGPWRLANSPALAFALPNAYFDSLGIPRLTGGRSLNPPNRRIRTRTYGGVGGEKPRGSPLSRCVPSMFDSSGVKVPFTT